jgi:hypothetical protein
MDETLAHNNLNVPPPAEPPLMFINLIEPENGKRLPGVKYRAGRPSKSVMRIEEETNAEGQ